jgi:PrcB C-terminal
LAVALSFCRLIGLGCPKQAFAKIATLFLKIGLLTILTMLTSLETQAATFVPYQVIDSSLIRISDAQNLVIRTKTAWQSFYQAATNWIYPQPSVPSVDFSRVVVVVVASGEKPTGGYKTLISGVANVPASISVPTSYIDVQAVLINPDVGVGCFVTQVFTYPVAMFTVGNVYNKCK